MALLLKYWKELVAIFAIVGGLAFAYYHVEQTGYNRAVVVYEKKIQDYNDKLDRRIDNIEKNSDALVMNAINSKDQYSKEFKAILAAAKGKPTYIVQNGNCLPSQDFVNTYNAAIRKANEK